MKIIRRIEDVRTLCIIFSFFILIYVQWNYTSKINNKFLLYFIGIPLWFLSCAFSFLCAVINHNVVHTPVFYHKYLNSIIQRYGHPSSTYVPGHNLSHHKYTQTRKDFMRTNKVNYKWNILNGLLFFFVINKDVLRNDWTYFKAQKRLRRRIYFQVILEIAILFIFSGICCVLDLKKFFILIWIPQMFGKWGIASMNLLQHDGCEFISDDHNSVGRYNHSRNFTGAVLNFWILNNGYHGIHHMYPGLHWADLPKYHKELIEPYIHPNLVRRSMWLYIWEIYVYPGIRVDYRGKPYVHKVPGTDEKWFYEQKETHSDLKFKHYD